MDSSADTIRRMRAQTDTVLLAFSIGKDSIAAWLELRKHFERIVPYYMYYVPDLEFVEDSLDYYEQFFGERIWRLPHPSLYRWLINGVFQPPDRAETISRLGLEEFSYLDIQDSLREDLGLPCECYAATGVRTADSPMRLVAIKRHGAISHAKRQFHAIWDWRKTDLQWVFRASGVKLPVDYKVWGRSFDGIDYRFLEPMQREFPRDYQRVLEWFPLAEAELRRREYASQ